MRPHTPLHGPAQAGGCIRSTSTARPRRSQRATRRARPVPQPCPGTLTNSSRDSSAAMASRTAARCMGCVRSARGCCCPPPDLPLSTGTCGGTFRSAWGRARGLDLGQGPTHRDAPGPPKLLRLGKQDRAGRRVLGVLPVSSSNSSCFSSCRRRPAGVANVDDVARFQQRGLALPAIDPYTVPAVEVLDDVLSIHPVDQRMAPAHRLLIITSPCPSRGQC